MGSSVGERLHRYFYRYWPWAVDMLFAVCALPVAFLVRFEGDLPGGPLSFSWGYTLLIVALVRGAVNYTFGFYRQLWEYAGRREFILIAKATASGSLLITALAYMRCFPVLPRSVILLDWFFYTAFVGLFRLQLAATRQNNKAESPKDSRRVIIAGAGAAGAMLMREFIGHREFEVVAFCDDDPLKYHQRILGVRVEGTCDELPQLAKRLRADQIIIALPSAERSRIREIVTLAKKTGLEVKTVPALFEIANGRVSIRQLREIKPEDLLGRSAVKYSDPGLLAGYIEDKVVLVTGAGGSIGSELCRQIAQLHPKELILLGRGENSIYEIENELLDLAPKLKLRTIIADIRQEQKMNWLFEKYRPQIVYHAAAHKHVPLMERNPDEAITNNVMGTMNVAKAADRFGTERFILISTDKAVKPTSVMGASKRLAEVVIQELAQSSPTKFMAVRFGNVLGSRGSVVPKFRKQIQRGGPVTITDSRMTRYFMTIPEAVMLVLHAGALGSGGEIFILDMGEPVRIEELACQLIRAMGYEPNREIKIAYTGIRPGEKLYEELSFNAETMAKTAHPQVWSLMGGRPGDLEEFEADFEKMIRFAIKQGSQDEVRNKLIELVELVDSKCFSGSGDDIAREQVAVTK
mgnify:CR=1 FL=1